MSVSGLTSCVQRYYIFKGKLWKEIIDCKYNIDSANLFSFKERASSPTSPFLKGVLWAAQATQMGYKWKSENGRRFRFWKDQWFGTCSLAI
jgi:hypothetical protein